MWFKSKFAFWYTAIALCLVTLVSRSPFTELSPIIDKVVAEYNLSSTQQGAILALPTFVMAIASVLVAKVDEKIGVVLAILLSLVLIAVGIYQRDFLSGAFSDGAIYVIYLGTIILATGITIMSVLYPTFINAFFPQNLGSLNAVNGANLSVSSLLGTLSSIVMIKYGYSWRDVGLLWIIITLVIIILYLPVLGFTAQRMQQLRYETKEQIAQERAAKLAAKTHAPTSTRRSMWTQIAAWSIAIGLGIESANFYFALSWFKTYAGEAFTGEQYAVLINIFQFCAIPFSLIAPVLVMKYVKQLNVILLGSAIIFSATMVLSLVITNYYLLLIDFIVFGSMSGVLLAAYLLLLSLKTKRPSATSRLSSMVNCVGFLLTAIFLLGFGWLYDLTQSFVACVVITVGLNILLPLFTYLAAKMPISE